MEKQTNASETLPLWQNVRALIAAAWHLLRADEVSRYLRAAQLKIAEAENAVRGWLAGLALGMDVPAAAAAPRPPAGKKPQAARKSARGFSVLPPPLGSLTFEQLRAPKFELASTWLDQRIASLHARAEMLDAVRQNPGRYVRRLARMLSAGDALAVSLRFFSVGVALPKEKIRAYLAPLKGVPVDDSS